MFSRNHPTPSQLQLPPPRTMVSSCASLSRRWATQSCSEWRKVRAGSGMEARLAVSTRGSVQQVGSR